MLPNPLLRLEALSAPRAMDIADEGAAAGNDAPARRGVRGSSPGSVA